MSKDTDFIATGGAGVIAGFQTQGTLDKGAVIEGTLFGGLFFGGDGSLVPGIGPSAALMASGSTGFGLVACTLDSGPVGVYGENYGFSGAGVSGLSDHYGVLGQTRRGEARGFLGGRDPVFNELAGVYGESAQAGVFGNSDASGGTGVHGRGGAADSYGVRGESAAGIAIHGKDYGKGVGVQGESVDGLAGRFIGNVEVTGDISLTNADCAEDFDVLVAETAEPGTVMVIEDSGALVPCSKACDKRVAGVVSGAGLFRPAIVLDQQGERANRVPIALLGKVSCKVDARLAAIDVGDLLTTSATSGYAMKADIGATAFGAVLGKALRPLALGERGLLPILVALQ